MFKHFILCNILFIPLIHGSTIPALKAPDQSVIKNETTKSNQIKLTQNVVSEGDLNDPITLLNENSENELIKEKSVVGRKGVLYTHDDDKQSYDNVNANSSNLNQNVTDTLISVKPNIHINEKNVINNTQNVNVTKIHKPLKISHEDLAKMDKVNNVDIEENVPEIKLFSMNAGSHPGMIMPIVITILVIPMFAVVGYLALKRGQEAWKNRHYKRMDFLLDGMYND